MKKMEEIDPDKMLINPFAFTLRIEVTQITDSKKYIPDNDGVMHPVSFLAERESSTKVFQSVGARDAVCNLSPCAKSLYLYILYSVEPGSDYIRINPAWYMKKCGIKSINTYKEGAKELCRYCFINESSDYKDVYWINPAMFFCGSRIDKFPKNVVIKSKKTL